jgi:DNA polymerase III delta prime subunit
MENLVMFDGFVKVKSNIDKKYSNIKLPWVEKYRPKTSDEILLDPFVKVEIDKFLDSKSIPNLIITGEPGTGKTSTIIYLARKIYNENIYNEYVLELNASDDRGLSMINNTIYPFCKKKTSGLHKLIILDECDSITPKAQNLLDNIIAKFENTRFVFICNDSTQIIESIQSRCIPIKYPRISKDDLFKKIEYICKEEKIIYNKEGINELLFVSDMDIRQSINNLECIYYAFKNLSIETVYKMVDKPKPVYIEKILNDCLNHRLQDGIETTKELFLKGYYPNDILLIFMKCLLEKDLKIKESNKLKIHEIISLSYIRVNGGIDTLLQLCGCIAKIYLFLGK